jgi:hypothetical protein
MARSKILIGPHKEQGQSTIEFALTLILMMGLIFFFMQLSLIFGFGNYVHYATFMAARAYLSAGPGGPDEQGDRAKNVIIRTMKRSVTQSGIDRFPAIARGQGGSGDVAGFELNSPQYVPGDYNLSWIQGVRYTFRSRLFLIPLGGTGGGAASANSPNSVTLTSESWLGREPSEEECKAQLGKVNGIYDNGC